MRRVPPVLIALATVFVGCTDRSDFGGTAPLTDTAQRALIVEQSRQYQAHLDRADRGFAHAEHQDQRFDALLDKWENQARRLDALLSRWEELTVRIASELPQRPGQPNETSPQRN